MSSTERADPTSQRARAEELFAVLAWLLCAVVLVVYVARYAAPLPFSDDVLMAPYVDPHEPLTGFLLWLQHNEHRIPLVKLLYVALVGGMHDLRAGCWFQAVALLGLSAGVLWGLRRRTGRLVASDAAIPLVLLTTSNTENLLNSFQIAFTLPVVLAGSLLVVALFRRGPPSGWGMAAIGLVLLALVACGSVGIVQASVFALWIAVVAVRACSARAPGWKRTAATTALVLAALLAFLQAYFDGFEHLPGHAAPGLARYLSVAVQFFTCSVGAVAMPIWPWSGVAVLVALAGGSFVLVRSLRGTDSTLALALLAQLLAGIALALAIAYGRAADGPHAGFTNRYVVLAALPLCTAYLAVRLLGRGLPARLGELALTAVLLAGFIGNYEYAFMVGHGRDLIVRRFQKHAAEGAGLAELANTSWPSFYYGETEFRDLLGQWRRAGFVDRVLPGERVGEGAEPLGLLPATTRVLAVDEPLAARLVGGRYAVLTRGRAHLAFDVPADARRFRAKVALDPLGRDPRLRLRLTGRTASGAERVLHERELAPRTRPDDAAGVEIDLELAPDDLATLELALEPAGPSSSPRFGLLSAVEFHPDR